MMGDLANHLGRELIEARLRVAETRRRSEAEAAERAAAGAAAHERQRELVCASLLLSRHADAATHGRWA